jgi:uncharacterized membrane protein YedE/YeeE/TusA-related sulfurtransferase
MLITGLIVGGLLGFAMQRGRFCVTGFLRDIFTLRSWRGFTALLVVIAVHAVGLAALTSTGVITPEFKDFAPAAVVVGAFLFGLGIILAGGCASGTWYRAGEGLVGSWIALVMYAVSSAAMKGGALGGLNDWLRGFTVDATTAPASLGISTWWFVIPLALVTAGLVRYFLAKERATPAMATLAPRKTGLAHLLTEKPWHVFGTAAVVGVLGVVAWPLSDATGRNTGLGITTPSADIVKGIVNGGADNIDWGVLLVLGILVGSFFAAKASGEFRVRVPDARQASRSVVGGLLMGVGASWAGGCTVGNGMVQTSLFSYQGWVALVFMALGVGVAAKLWLKPDQPVNRQDVEIAPTGASAAPAPADYGLTSAVSVLERPLVAASTGTTTKNGLTDLGDGRWGMDTLGSVCPFPLIEAKNAIGKIDVGDELVIGFDCTQATDAIPRWAATDGHEVTRFEARGDAGWVIAVKRGH